MKWTSGQPVSPLWRAGRGQSAAFDVIYCILLQLFITLLNTIAQFVLYWLQYRSWIKDVSIHHWTWKKNWATWCQLVWNPKGSPGFDKLAWKCVEWFQTLDSTGFYWNLGLHNESVLLWAQVLQTWKHRFRQIEFDFDMTHWVSFMASLIKTEDP